MGRFDGPHRTMRLSCGNDSFPTLPHELSVGLVAELGFDGYDLSLARNISPVRPDDVLADIPRAAGVLEERVRGRGLTFSDVFYLPDNDFRTLCPNHPDRAERERGRKEFADIVELAVRLEAPGMTVMPGMEWPGESHEESLARSSEELGRRVSIARERGVRVSFEGHVGSVCRSPSDIARLLDLTPGLELTLDYTHYYVQGFGEAELEALIPRARHFHARGGDAERLQAPIRECPIDYERIVEAMRECGYDGYISIEYCWVDWERLNEIDVLSETIILRDRLRAKLAGESWVLGQDSIALRGGR
jgi:sugar phosphate isomerase/epimerase